MKLTDEERKLVVDLQMEKKEESVGCSVSYFIIP